MRRFLNTTAVVTLFLVMFTAYAAAQTEFMQVVESTGITVVQDGEVTAWTGPYGGKIKPTGPLAGRKIGLLVGCEFSDWQAYYFADYIGEFGGTPQFIMNNSHLWKTTRPMWGTPTQPFGMWGLSLTGGMDGLGVNGNRAEPPALIQQGIGDVANLKVADPKDYDALIILGAHSGDILCADAAPLNFIRAVADRNVPIAAIGGGILPLIHLGIVNGKNVTGDAVTGFMLERVANFADEPVVVDGNLITGRDTISSPAVLRALCSTFDPAFVDRHKDILAGKKIMTMIVEDWEDIELCAPTLELMYRGADYVVGLFEPEMKSRPALLGLDVRTGSFGTTVPFQEISLDHYRIVKQEELTMEDFDLLFIPGAFNPWQITMGHCGFLREAYDAGKIVASICHGPIPVAAAGLAEGRKMTGWLACENPVNIMGGTFMPDWAAAIDGRIVSGRTPPEAPEFVDAITEALLRE